jgi:hypothetical protein
VPCRAGTQPELVCEEFVASQARGRIVGDRVHHELVDRQSHGEFDEFGPDLFRCADDQRTPADPCPLQFDARPIVPVLVENPGQ